MKQVTDIKGGQTAAEIRAQVFDERMNVTPKAGGSNFSNKTNNMSKNSQTVDKVTGLPKSFLPVFDQLIANPGFKKALEETAKANPHVWISWLGPSNRYQRRKVQECEHVRTGDDGRLWLAPVYPVPVMLLKRPAHMVHATKELAAAAARANHA